MLSTRLFLFFSRSNPKQIFPHQQHPRFLFCTFGWRQKLGYLGTKLKWRRSSRKIYGTENRDNAQNKNTYIDLYIYTLFNKVYYSFMKITNDYTLILMHTYTHICRYTSVYVYVYIYIFTHKYIFHVYDVCIDLNIYPYIEIYTCVYIFI